MNRSLALVLMTLGAAVGCSSTPEPSSSSNDTPPGGSTSLGPSVDKDQTLSGDITMTGTTTIAAGVTLTLSAGATLQADNGAQLVVLGTLVAEGASGDAVVFQSKAHGGAGGWAGIKVDKGGNATLTHAEIHDATLAFEAAAESSYALDHILVDTSSKLASLSADGTIKHSQFHGLGDKQGDSPFLVNEASPQVTDTVIDKGRDGGVDLIVVNGASSSPLFDHVEVANAHCVFHFNGSKDAKVTNSIIRDSAFAMMITASTGLSVKGNNFKTNGINIGVCTTGDIALEGNHFADGEVFDSSCMAQTNTGASDAPLADVGPRP